MTNLDQVIDHAAELQARLDQLQDELLMAYLCILALTVLIAAVAYNTRGRRP